MPSSKLRALLLCTSLVVGCSSGRTSPEEAVGATAAPLLSAPQPTLQPADVVGASFGASVESAGDVNKDGYADVVVTAPGWGTTAVPKSGRAYLYLGGPTGLTLVPGWPASPAATANA